MNRRTRLATAACAALATAGIAVGTLPTAAAAAPAVDCIQNPAANSHNAAQFTGTNINIRTGPFTVCTAIGEGQPSHNVTAHCLKFNSNGVPWVYLTDHTTGKTGWSDEQFVTWSGGLIGC